MTTLFLHALALSLLLAVSFAESAHAWNRSPAITFATLPAGSAHPEGITADAHGNIYVTTFEIDGTPTGNGQLFVFDHHGKLVRQVNVAGSSTLLLDLAFHPITGALLVIDFGAQKVLTVDPVSGTSSLFATIPGGTAAGPNVLTFDDIGNVYISDSFQWKIVDHAMQVLGGIGYTTDFPIQAIFRNARLMRIGAGSDEIMKFLIARELLREVKG